MAKRNRKARNSGIPADALLRPFNVLDFGDPEKDPCFGKLYDLNADECQSCGDIEWCSRVFTKKLQGKRQELESAGNNLDIQISNLEKDKDIREYYQSMLDKGLSSPRALKRTARRYNSKLEIIKSIINNEK